MLADMLPAKLCRASEYVFSTLCFKVALCFSYLRLTSGGHERNYRIAIWTGLTFTVLYNVTYIFTLIFACSPVAASWDHSIDSKCMATDPYYYSTGFLTMFNDLVLFFLPVPLVWRMQLDRRVKLGLTVTFLLGLVTTFCSIIRIVAIKYIDKTGNTTNFILWGVVEACVGVSVTMSASASGKTAYTVLCLKADPSRSNRLSLPPFQHSDLYYAQPARNSKREHASTENTVTQPEVAPLLT